MWEFHQALEGRKHLLAGGPTTNIQKVSWLEPSGLDCIDCRHSQAGAIGNRCHATGVVQFYKIMARLRRGPLGVAKAGCIIHHQFAISRDKLTGGS